MYSIVLSKKHNIKITGNKTPDAVLDKLLDAAWLEEQINTKGVKALSEELGLHPASICRYAGYAGIQVPTKYREDLKIFKFIKSLGVGDVKYRCKKTLDKLEIDIFIPSLKIGIEYNGLYWYSTAIEKTPSYHLEKTKAAEEKGIRLIHIFENEWIHNEELVKDKLRAILGKSTKTRVYARKCTIEKANNVDVRDFYNKNHIQGYGRGDIDKIYTLLYEGDIDAAMSFNTRRGYIELTRYATSMIVVGGFSKLLAAFIADNPEIKEIVSFADKRWSTGDVYFKNGFKHVSDTRPNYYYITDKYRLVLERKEKFQKKNLEKILPEYDPTLSEFANMTNHGYHRIYDCGLMKFVLYLEQDNKKEAKE